ncbi:MAG TPA: glutamate-cysteine ligase family protein [Pseudonocardiaceae bacterium]
MTALQTPAAVPVSATLHDRAAAETYVASVCFKHGPPKLVGIELEWTVHDAHDPCVPLSLRHLADALGPHAPPTVNPDSPNLPMPRGSLVTVEPGGQVEISAPPQASLADLITAVTTDADALAAHLAERGLVLGTGALDQQRDVRRLLDTPRYAAMAAAFAPNGPDGLAWMCASAGLQVCLDAGEPDRLPARWAALHALGPVLSALFANSRQSLNSCATWVSGRMRTMFRVDATRTRPAVVTGDPVAAWVRRALDAPVICVRRPDGCWEPPGRISFADWIGGAIDGPPTEDDLDYHLSTLFPPVRPRGYLEVRYLDAQAGDGWVVPSVVLAALMADEATVDAALAAAEPAAGRWLHAARYGLADQRIAAAGRAVVEVATRVLGNGSPISADIGPALTERVVDELTRRIEIGANGHVEGACSA